jgi:endonuclease YncB( thermonuclease family)
MGVALGGIAFGSAHAAAPKTAPKSTPPSPACQLEAFATGTVQAVVDGRTFVLADGRKVRLDGIEIPPQASPTGPTPPPASDESPDPAVAAAAALDALIVGHEVVLKHVKPATDRYGRLLADAFVAPENLDDAGSIAKILVAQGVALIAARPGGAVCMAELRAAERAAQAAKLGLWGDPRYFPCQAEDVGRLSAEHGRFTLVEGKVVSVRESGATIYVNFGQRWSEDFTVTILKRNERLFAAAGLEPRKLAGRRVMVRGWIEERGGPWIEATAPDQIEIVAEK